MRSLAESQCNLVHGRRHPARAPGNEIGGRDRCRGNRAAGWRQRAGTVLISRRCLWPFRLAASHGGQSLAVRDSSVWLKGHHRNGERLSGESVHPARQQLVSGAVGQVLGADHLGWVGKPEPRTDGTYEGGHIAAINDLIDSVKHNRPTKCSAEDCRSIIEMIAAVFESHRVGGPIELPMTTRVNPLTLMT